MFVKPYCRPRSSDQFGSTDMSPVRSAPAATDRLAPKRSANSSAAQQHLRSTGPPGQIDPIIAYCGAASLLGLGYPAANSRFGTIVMLISLAATLEVAQRWIPSRHPQFIDFAASVTGTCLGMLAAMVVHRIALVDLRSR